MVRRVVGSLVAAGVLGLTASLWTLEEEVPPLVLPEEVRPPGVPYAERHQRPDLVLVTIDTLRRDHVSAYGYERETTPFIDGLAKRGVVFEDAWSTSSWTLPAVASMVSGTWPVEHGLHRAQRFEQEVLDPGLPNLAERLRSLGYRTAAVVANGHLDGRFGFDRGFDRYVSAGFSNSERVGPALLEVAEGLQEGPPFFLWVHLFDPHGSYLRREAFDTFAPGAGRRVPQEKDLWDALETGGVPVGMLEEVVAAYDSEIRHDDALLERVFEVLPRASDAFVVVTGDHGERFGEGGGFGHGRTLVEAVTRIPMVVVAPEGTPGRREGVVSLVDVFPTLLAAAGVAEEDRGTSLLEDGGERMVFLDVRREASLQAVITDHWRLDRQGELIDRATGLVAVEPGVEGELARGLRRYDGLHEAASVALERSAAERTALESLGYLDP